MNAPKALGWDVVWSIVPDIIIKYGGAIIRKIGTVIEEAAERWKMPVAYGTDLGYVDSNRNLLKVGDYDVILKNMNGSNSRFHTYGDALRENLEPAYLSHPEEYDAMLNNAKNGGFS